MGDGRLDGAVGDRGRRGGAGRRSRPGGPIPRARPRRRAAPLLSRVGRGSTATPPLRDGRSSSPTPRSSAPRSCTSSARDTTRSGDSTSSRCRSPCSSAPPARRACGRWAPRCARASLRARYWEAVAALYRGRPRIARARAATVGEAAVAAADRRRRELGGPPRGEERREALGVEVVEGDALAAQCTSQLPREPEAGRMPVSASTTTEGMPAAAMRCGGRRAPRRPGRRRRRWPGRR